MSIYSIDHAAVTLAHRRKSNTQLRYAVMDQGIMDYFRERTTDEPEIASGMHILCYLIYIVYLNSSTHGYGSCILVLLLCFCANNNQGLKYHNLD